METNDKPACRRCPSKDFDLQYVSQSRYMAICHAVECVLEPKFPDEIIRESNHISRAIVATVIFVPLDNCPHVEELRAKGKIPWATATIDESK